mmetsp:Transcript_16567/g.27470  ORF Transcript_16567/g.27470 Transcript_16567/m.27470 type:complete len:376 (-) Transcript_16567:229-1356(-)
MKFVLSLLISAVAGVAASSMDAPMDFVSMEASSKAGENLLLSSRQLEDVDEAMVARHSIIYDGCHNTTSWADGVYSVVPLIRFRLCPSKYVHSGRCFSSRLGEYLVEMTTFVDSYLEYKREMMERKCETIREACGCDGDNDDCAYYCYDSYSDDLAYSQCAEEQGEEERYGECQKLEIENDDDDGGRRLEDGDGGYYMGPYCGPGGKGVFLTLFTDEACSTTLPGAAEYYSYLSGGVAMPYQYSASSTGLVDTGSWISCAEQDENEDDNGNNNNNDEDARSNEMCQAAYQGSAKCERNMTYLTYPDSSACAYIAQIKSNGNSAFQSTDGGSTDTMSWAALLFIIGGVAALGGVYRASKRDSSSKSTPLVEVEMSS